MKYLKRTNQEIRNEFKNQPRLSRDEKVTLILFVATVALWVFSSQLSDLLGVDIPIALPVIFLQYLYPLENIDFTPFLAIYLLIYSIFTPNLSQYFQFGYFFFFLFF